MKQKPANREEKAPNNINTRKRDRGSQTTKRLQFEMMISNLSNVFINIPAEDIDQEIESGLRRVVEFLGFDRGSILLETEKGHFINSHNWSRSEIDPAPMFIAEQQYPRGFKYFKEKKKPIIVPDLDNPPSDFAKEAVKLKNVGLKSVASVPLIVGGLFLGVLAVGTVRAKQPISLELVHRFRMLGEIFSNALIRKKTENSLRQAYTEIKQLKDQLETECVYLREEIKLEHDFTRVIGKSQAIQNILFQVEQVAVTETTVLILGETGTGKELIARSLHNVSLRKDRPLIKVDCASLPANLIENELFGHEKGAFTGATEKKIGRLEVANGGTVFLDEIGELPLELQPKLLRVIQENAFERLGGTQTIQVNIRVIAATNRNLEEEVRKGRFREDLWYRLNVFPISIPPLRERKKDIPLLVEWIVQQSGKKLGRKIEKISNAAIEALRNYNWPGNIRELENVITRALITTSGKILQIESFKEIQNLPPIATESCMTLAEIEGEHILKTLQKTGWKIQGPKGAAETLGLKPTTLRDRMKKRGIKRPTIF
jgi:formate hydrogenlyase transcriptional activator